MQGQATSLLLQMCSRCSGSSLFSPPAFQEKQSFGYDFGNSVIATSSCNESDLKGHSKVQAASEISRMIWWKNMLCFLTILFYCRSGIWSYSRATRCSSELHWPSGRAWKSEFIPVKINRKILLIFLSNIKKHPGCDQRGRVLQRNGAALQGDARVEQQGLQQTHQGEFQLKAMFAYC